MFYTEQDTLEQLRALPEEYKKMIAAELTVKGYDVIKDLVPVLTAYFNVVRAEKEHAKAIYTLILPQLKRQEELWQRNEAVMGLKTMTHVKAVKKLNDLVKHLETIK